MKKFLALTMALAMSLSLVACGGGDKPAESTPAASTPAASTPAASTPAEKDYSTMTIDELKAMPVDEAQKPADADLAAGCTMAVYNFLPSVEDAVRNAQHLGAKKGDMLKLTTTANASKSKDASESADGQAQVYAHVGVVTLNGETITSCYIDAVQATVKFNASGKITSDLGAAVLSKNVIKDGYGMKGASSIGKEWYEQAAGFCAYVTGKTIADVAGIAIVDGKVADADLAATTTIGIADFQALIEKAGK